MSRVLSILHNTIWAMKIESFEALQQSVKLSADSMFDMQLKVDDPAYNVFNSVAIIPVKGTISKNVSVVEKIIFDIIDINDISAMFSAANRDPDVEAIVLDINSHGGTISGIAEMYDQISKSSKPVITFTDETIASAAYWIASASDAIYITKAADLGGIGVFASLIDYSKAFEQQGLKREMIISNGSKFKGAGVPGTSLTEEQREQIQNRVDYLNGMFLADVNSTRNISDEDQAGQVFIGELAVDTGYADSVIDTIDFAIGDSLILAKKRE